MLTFLRKVRKSLIETGSAQKYLFYAIGEIALVVMGILIALQINNWNEDRQSKKKETDILYSLKSSLEKDLNDLDQNIILHSRIANSCNILLDHIRRDAPYNDSLSIHFGDGIQLYSIFVHTTSAFQTLKSYGVDLISNEILRNRIIGIYDGRYNYLRKAEKFYTERIENALNGFLNTRFKEPYDFNSKDSFYTSRMIPVNYEILKKDRDFKYFLRASKNRNNFYLHNILIGVREEVVNTIDDINTELNRLD